jgi:hypothetical protein
MEGETKYGMSMIGKHYPAFPNVEKTGQCTINDFLDKSGFVNAISSKSGITFGAARVSPADLSNIVYDDSGGYVAILPAKEENGVKVVNLNIIKEYSDIVKKIVSKGIDQHSE